MRIWLRLAFTAALLVTLTRPVWAQEPVQVLPVAREDDTTANQDRGFPILVKRCNSVSQSASADGKLGYLCTNANGELYVVGTLTGTLVGTLSHNVAAPVTTNIGAMGRIACTSVQSFTAGRVVFPCSDVYGSSWVVLKKADGSDVTYLASVTEAATEAAAGTLQAVSAYGKAYDGTTFSRLRGRSAIISSGDFGLVTRPFLPSDGTNTMPAMDASSRAGFVQAAAGGFAVGSLPPAAGTLKSGAITTAMTSTTSTSLIAAQASNYLYVTNCVTSNGSTTVSTDILLQDGSGGTTLYVLPAPAATVATTGGGGGSFTFPTPLKVPTLGNALFAANVTTGSSTKVSCNGWYSTTSY